jgi:hypothetical protein
MKAVNPNLLVMVCLTLAVSSCKNLYVQKNIFVPILKEKGELKAEASIGREAVTLNTAYALNDHFSVMLNGFSAIDNSAQYKRNYNYQLEGAFGFQSVFKDSLHFESYVGLSQGWYDTNFERATGDLKDFQVYIPYDVFGNILLNFFFNREAPLVNTTGNYQTLFFQNSISYLSKKSSTSFTLRAQYIQFRNYREEGEFDGQKIWYGITIPPKIFFQPAMTNKIKIYDKVNMVGQVGYNFPMFEQPNFKNVFEWNNMFYYIGIEVAFDTKRWK